MNENLKQAILKVKEMPEVQEKLTKAETLEEAYEIIQSVGSGFTLDEFKAAMEEMNKTMARMAPIMSVSISMIAPLGLALYWFVSNILMIIERTITSKYLKEE